MSVREKFLKDFNFLSKNFPENISVYYTSDLKKTLAISYFELNKVSDELCEYFLKIFGKNSQYIGVLISDYFFLPCIILAIWKSDCSFAGVGSQYTGKNNLDFLNLLRVKYLICDSNKSDYDGELVSEFAINERRFFIWTRRSQTEGDVLISLEDICYGIMTSGSTGEPKIIQVPWSCILLNAVELLNEFQVTINDSIFLASPYSFDPFFIELFIAFLSGCSLMIVSCALKLSPSDLLKTLFEERESQSVLSSSGCVFENNKNFFYVRVQEVKGKKISILQMTPSVFKRWTNTEIEKFIFSKDTSLRILILGGENFPAEVLKLKNHNNKTRIFNVYGITEISCWAFLKEISDYCNNGKISIGKPLENIVYKITKSGELFIGSNARICFVNDEKLCEVRNTVFRETGDIVELVDNEIYYVGRTNQIVKKYGMKINLGKIEFFLLSRNSQIKECYVLYNNESQKLGLFYVPIKSEENNENFKLRTLEEFSENYVIPIDDIKDIEKPDYFVEMTKAPLNSHGKCDKQELQLFLKSLKTKKSESSLKNLFRRLWVETLGMKHKNLFTSGFKNLGGNSVLGLNLITKLMDEGINVPQNFISILLGEKGYDECLKCLSLGACEAPRKRFKYDSGIQGVKLSISWRFDFEKCVDATPSYFTYKGEERIVIGSHSSKLSCLNPNTGCDIWTKFLGDRIESGFKTTKDGSKGFIGCYDHFVYCIDCSNGNVIWKFKTNDMVKSTPCLSNDEKNVYVGSYDTNLYCLSVDEGQLITQLKLSNGGIFSSGITCPSLNNLYIGTLDGTCIAINLETNAPTWKTILQSPVFASPCLISNQIIFSEVLGNVHCLNAFTGTKIWTFKVEGNIYSSPTVTDSNGVHYIFFGCHDAHLYCIRFEKDPELMWKQHLDSSVFAKPSVLLESLFVCAATTKGFIYLCDFVSGSIKTLLKLDGEVFSSPVCNNNRVFVGCRDNYVYCIAISKTENLIGLAGR